MIDTTERKYWNWRYITGSSRSGKGLKPVWEFINSHVGKEIKEKCIDIGCGDLSFWKIYKFFYRECKEYIGLDVSDYIIGKNRKKRKFKNKRFICSGSGNFIRELLKSSEVVLAIDLLFHIMNDKEYVQTLVNLCRYSTKYIILTEWFKDSGKYNKKYQKYRDFNSYQDIFLSHGFEMIDLMKVSSIGNLYVYRKRLDK